MNTDRLARHYEVLTPWEDPAFSRRLKQLRADRVQRTAGSLTAASGESVRTLVELQKPSAPPAVRLEAARSVLEIGRKVREVADLEARWTALEKAAGEDRKG